MEARGAGYAGPMPPKVLLSPFLLWARLPFSDEPTSQQLLADTNGCEALLFNASIIRPATRCC